MIPNGTQQDDSPRSGEPSDPNVVSGYEITIRVTNKEVASRLVTNLVRSDCYELIAGLRVAALVEGVCETDALPSADQPADQPDRAR